MKKFTLALLAFFLLPFIYAQVNLNTGLAAYYPFNGNANDVSGNNNNPFFNNATLTSDRFGNPNAAYHFNGTNNYIQIANNPSLNFNKSISIVAWVKVTGFYAGTCHGNRIIMKGSTEGGPGNYFLTFDDNAYTNGQNCFIPAPDVLHQNFFGDRTSQPSGGYTPYVQTAQWYCVIYTSDGTTARLYVNCELKGEGLLGSFPFTNADDLFFGKLNNSLYPYWFNGDLDDVRIYNRALNIFEINVLGGCNNIAGCNSAFQKTYGGSKDDVAYNGSVNANGSFITAGYTASFGSGGYDGYLQKTDKAGNIAWNKVFGGAGNDYFVNAKQAPDGGFVAVGNTGSFGGAQPVAWMVKTDSLGVMQWARKFDDGNPNGSILRDVAFTSDGGYALTGTNRAGASTANVLVVKTDNTGNVQWAKSFESGNTDESFGIVEDADSLVVVANQYGQSSSFYDAVIMKLNRINGSVIWARNFDIEGKANRPTALYKTSSGYVIDCYDDNGFSIVNPEQVIINTNRTGVISSLYKITDPGAPRLPLAYAATADNGFIVSQAENNANTDAHIIKVSSTGTIQWTKKYGGAGRQGLLSIAQTPDGGYFLSGTSNSTPAVVDSGNIYLVKTDSLGNTPGCVTTASTATITSPAFSANASFVWAAVTNVSFGATSITPANAGAAVFSNALCASCLAPVITDTVINDYTPVTAFDPCKNILTVVDGSKYKVGDTVLIMQMKGAVIDSSNTATFGAITNYKNAGNYEFNYVKSKNGNLIELKNFLTRQYDLPNGKVQLIRVPFYQKLNLPNILTCQPWNGSTGGVLAFNVIDTLNLNADIDVSGKGFRGTPIDNHVSSCHENQYFYNSTSANAGFKGEGIFTLSANNAKGKGKAANAGGGGNGANAGGGGGSNFGGGGLGGKEFLCSAQPQTDNGGLGGTPLAYTSTANKIFMGGSGGTGDENDNTGSAGGNGGGIVLITAGSIQSNTYKINSKGITPAACTGPNCGDGQGGGGAGGTAVLNITNFLDNTTVNTSGGDGGSYTNINPTGYYGPGGGGGGGALWLKSGSLPANVTPINAGGVNGTWLNTTQAGGAGGGNSGGTLFNANPSVDLVPFKSTFDSAKFDVIVTTCTSFKFQGLANIDNSKVVKWQWAWGDGAIDSTQNVFHNYLSPGTYPVRVIATDNYGCVATLNVDLTVFCRCEAITITSPNPAQDKIVIDGLGCGNNTITLYNMLGQRIQQVISNKPTETLYVSNLSRGMYIVRIVNSKKMLTHLRVEKM